MENADHLPEGQFVQDKRQGLGTYTFPNGDTYTGSWEDDKKHGKGVYAVSTNGSKVDHSPSVSIPHCHQLEGHWEAGQLKGTGEVTHLDHVLKATFNAEGQPDLPAEVTFLSTNYTLPVEDKAQLGQRVAVPAAEE